MECLICKETHSKLVFNWKKLNRSYFKCSDCEFVFLSPSQRLSSIEERAQYDLHENHPNDPHYRAFLGQIIPPIQTYFKGRSDPLLGIDYGCGPGPTLSRLIEATSLPIQMADYDPAYFPNNVPTPHQYDLVTCSEVAEHFHNPDQEFQKLSQLLKSKGCLAIMTQRQDNQTDLSTWYYLRDPTHVSFYSETTLRILAQRNGLEAVFPSARIAIFHFPDSSTIFKKD